MTDSLLTPQPVSTAPPRILPLEPGDSLTREEFERRYAAMPGLKKAELLEGVVFMPSPVRVDQHGSPHASLIIWLGNYWLSTPGVRAAVSASVRLDPDNEPQPDGVLFIEPTHGGQATITPDGYLEDGTELAAEVAASTASIDLNLKFRVYRRNRVREYIVWRVEDGAIDWFVLRGTQYDRLTPGADGIISSEVFPGLWLDPAALTRGDGAQVNRVLQQGLASPEHAAFVARLQQAATP